MRDRLLIILTILSVVVGSASAKVTMSPLFSDNMILQQLTKATIWGHSTAKDGEVKVTMSWNGECVTTKTNKLGEWRVEVATPSAGGGYTITVDDGDGEHTINNVLIGEVWVASGQSNMFRKLSGTRSKHVDNSTHYISLSRDPQLRILNVGMAVSNQPTKELKSQGWREASSGVVAGTSATAYHFARMMREALDVPVGIIVSAVGGTSINCWVDSAIAEKYADDTKELNEIYPYPSNRHSTVLYNAMICPIVGYAAKGFIWYQGESDITRPDTYAQKMADMVSLWRREWGCQDMAFYYAQIAPYEYEEHIAAGWHSMYIREAQLKALDLIPNSGMAVLSDAGERDDIHPARKDIPGERLAYQALEKSYGFEALESDAPTLAEVEFEGSTMRLVFDNARFGVTTLDKGELRDFEIAGEDGNFVAAKAVIEKGDVLLSAHTVKKPKYVRYGFKNWFSGSLYNIEGIPASSFRTDTFNKPKYR